MPILISRPTHFLLLAQLVLLFATPRLRAQSGTCPPAPKLLATSDPIYADAMELSRTLEENGFTIQCVFPTKFRSMFEVVVGRSMRTTAGEANFETNYGSVEVVFLPRTRTFADFKISEHRQGSQYVYTFAGDPRTRLGTGHPIYFLKQGNRLLLVDDTQLRARLEKTLHVSWQAP